MSDMIEYPVRVCATCGVLDDSFFSQADCQVAVCPRTAVEVHNRAELDAAVGRAVIAKPAGRPRYRFSDADIAEIQRRHENGESIASLARLYHAAHDTVQNAIRREAA